MDMLTVNVKKTVFTSTSLQPATSSIQAATSDIKDDNSITNGAITLTFGRMGVETFNGQPFTNELLWFNSSQGGAVTHFFNLMKYFRLWCFIWFLCFSTKSN